MTKINGEWDLTPDELALIFAIKGWQYANSEFGYGAPSADSIASVLNALVNMCTDDGAKGSYATIGRFLVVKDNDLPNSYDIYLRVGYVWDEMALMAAASD
ncbi:hypothetical protein [Nonomuraea sp. NPDC049141]|uniref:hypothetical protein n=1 Tax=Nonomuraea sp. NPDC049141 TaxID=3155500 RepID=UPI003410D739